jgi:hypothetical protein
VGSSVSGGAVIAIRIAVYCQTGIGLLLRRTPVGIIVKLGFQDLEEAESCLILIQKFERCFASLDWAMQFLTPHIQSELNWST